MITRELKRNDEKWVVTISNMDGMLALIQYDNYDNLLSYCRKSNYRDLVTGMKEIAPFTQWEKIYNG